MPDAVLTAAVPKNADELVDEFHRLWQCGQRPQVALFLEHHGPLSMEKVAAVLCADQRLRWQAGERVLVEHYLQARPDLDTDAVLDLVYGEFLLREELGDRPDLADYQRRFPEQAGALQVQVELHRAVRSNPSSPVESSRRPEETALSPTHRRPKALQQPLVPASPLHSDTEIRVLLRQRLLILYLIYIVGLALKVLAMGGGERLADAGLLSAGVELAVVLGLAVHAVILWRKPALSIRQLRRLELTGFALLTACQAWQICAAFSHAMLARYAGLGDEGVVALADHLSGPWFTVLVIYGMFVPNTWRRCAALVGVMAATPLAIGAVMTWDGSIGPEAQFAFLFRLTWLLGLAAAIAIYGSHKISTLRRQIDEARRLGQYQLKRRLGAGGMGEVYLAEHVRLRRPCAVKLIRPERAGDPREIRRFEREAQATATLTHPNTVQVFDYGHADDGTFYCAMEYLPGLNLDELVQQQGPLAPERAVHLLRQVCGALGEAHGIGLIHRDIKPGNIIVGPRGGQEDVAKLLDFGLVRPLDVGIGESCLTREGDIAGTPAFMSPEQAAGQRDLDGRSDIYSLGALAYFLLTGQPPFAGRSAVQVLAAHLYQEPAPLSDHRPDLPPELEEVVHRCLAKNPAERFPDVQSLERALGKALRNVTPPCQPRPSGTMIRALAI